MKKLTAIGWIGGKSAFVDKIIPFINKTPHRKWREAFCGSAVITLNKEPSEIELINDKHNVLVNFFRVVRDRPNELMESLEWELNAESVFNYYKMIDLRKIPSVEAARAFLFLNKAAFGQRVGTSSTMNGKGRGYWSPNTTGETKYNVYTLPRMIKKVHKRLSTVYITCRSYDNSPKGFNGPDVLTYLDPPYLDTAESSRSYAGGIELKDFWKYANSLEGPVIISHEANTRFEKAFRRWDVVHIGNRHNHIAGGTVTKKRSSEVPELLFFNYKVPSDRRGLFE